MRTVGNARKISKGLLLAGVLALMTSAVSLGALSRTPRVNTGSVRHAHGTSGQLEAVIDPNGIQTSYFFEFGPTVAYGKSTTPVAIGAAKKGEKVGQLVTGILPGYHYRAVATFIGTKGTLERVNGKDKSYSGGKSAALKFDIPKGKENEIVVTYGGTAEITGALTGLGNTSHGLVLQGVAFPFTEAFTALTPTVLSDLSGHFVFRVAKLRQTTQMRIVTTDRRPIYSSILTVHVTPKIILHIRKAAGTGRYRIYGTVAPASLRGLIDIQVLKPPKAGSKREGLRARTVGSAPIRRGSSSQAKFSVELTLSGTSTYRASVKLPAKGALSSGRSNSVQVHAPKQSTTKTRHTRKKKKK